MEKEWAKLELGMNVQLLTQSRKFPATGPQIHGDMLRLAIAYLLPMFYRTAHVVIGLPLDSIDTAKSDDDGTDTICSTSGIEIRLHSNIADNSRKVQIIVQDMGQTVDQHGAGSFDTCMPPMV
ncbi:hypothetical protein GGI13_000283 [Coemansia sp. RSA 455]|nr:hypothetical protein GGI08_000159 [Coemansia sp. S2]KAJ2258958.1 hypothetical protein GGI13_000283 [Coemansia sp. RSA 455]